MMNLEEREGGVTPDGAGEMGSSRSCKVFLGLTFILSVVVGHPPVAVWRTGWQGQKWKHGFQERACFCSSGSVSLD